MANVTVPEKRPNRRSVWIIWAGQEPEKVSSTKAAKRAVKQRYPTAFVEVLCRCPKCRKVEPTLFAHVWPQRMTSQDADGDSLMAEIRRY